MGITALTANSLARPLHTLQRWWQQLQTLPFPASCLWASDVRGTTQSDPCTVPVVTLRRARTMTCVATGHSHAATSNLQSPCHPAAKAPALPAFRRLNHRDFPSHANGLVRPDLLVLEPHSCTLSTLRVLHRPANLARPGGLVISGRMADVCAELDRLVALEALH